MEDRLSLSVTLAASTGECASISKSPNVLPAIRVLHCIGSLGGGGAERQLSYLAVELVRNGVEVHIAYQRGGHNLDELRNSGATLHELTASSNYDPLLLWRLVKLVRTVSPGLIQSWLTQMDVLAGSAAFLTRTPLLMTERSVEMAYEGSWKEYVRCWFGRRAALVIANSERGRMYWLARKRRLPVKVVHNAVRMDQIQRAEAVSRLDSNIPDTAEVLLFAGRYSPEKNLLNLLDAIMLVLADRRGAVAMMFGEGPLKEELTAKVRRERMTDRVKVMGYTSQLWNWMKRASLFVSVSLFEGNPNTVLEAAIQGCPLVVSDIPEHREVLGDDACFVSASSPNDIARGLLDVLENREAAKIKARAASGRAAHMTIESMAGQYLRAYRQILQCDSLQRSAVAK